MSRLDSVIRRLMAQRSCLDLAATLIKDFDGVVLEFGLGNGRTFDHLQTLMPQREIFVFERVVAAHPDCIPDSDHLILGDIYKTLPYAINTLQSSVILVHSDVGSHDKDKNRKITEFMSVNLPPLLKPGAIIVSEQQMLVAGSEDVELPKDVAPGRYYITRVGHPTAVP